MRRLWVSCAVVVALAGGWLAKSLHDATGAAPKAVVPAAVPQAAPFADAGLVPSEIASIDPREMAVAGATDPEVAPATDGAVAGFELRIVDPLDAPVAGARVRLPDVAGAPQRVTGVDGVCRFPQAEGPTVLVSVDADGFFPLLRWVESETEKDVLLHPLGQLSGRVLERETRAPVAGARLSVPWGMDKGDGRAVVCDASGSFAGLAVPVGASFRVDVHAAGYLHPAPGESSRRVEPNERDPSLEIPLDPALVGEFLILSSPGDDPVANAIVSIGPVNYESDDLGRVSVDRSLRSGEAMYRLRVRAAGHCGSDFEVEHVGSADAPCVLRLPRAARVSGVLRYDRGRAVRDVFVGILLDEAFRNELRRVGGPPTVLEDYRWPERASWDGRIEAARLDDERKGRFALDGLPPGLQEIELVVFEEQRVWARRKVGPLGGPGSSLELEWRLPPRGDGAVHGRLLRNGEPHAGFLNWVQGERSGQLMVRSDGIYSIDGLDPGTLELTAELWGTTGAEANAVASVLVVDGQRVEFDLRCEVHLAEISGTLTSVEGNPIGDIQVWASRVGEFGQATTTTDSDGTWSVMVEDRPGMFRIECAVPVREDGIEVRAGARDVALHAVAMGVVRFRAVAAESGLPVQISLERLTVSRTRVHVARPGSPAPDAAGWITAALPAGEHELRAWSMDGAWLPERRNLNIAAGLTSEVEFRMQAGLSLSLRLQPDSAPLPKEHVWLLLSEQEWPLVVVEWRNGRLHQDFAAVEVPHARRNLQFRPGSIDTLRGLAPGRYRFKVFPDDVRLEPEWIDVPSEGVVDVRWSFKQ